MSSHLVIIWAATFLSGALFEAFCVFYVHFSERNDALRTGACAVLLGAAQVFGIGESVFRGAMAAAYVLGLGAGAYVGVLLKSRRGKRIIPRG